MRTAFRNIENVLNSALWAFANGELDRFCLCVDTTRLECPCEDTPKFPEVKDGKIGVTISETRGAHFLQVIGGSDNENHVVLI